MKTEAAAAKKPRARKTSEAKPSSGKSLVIVESPAKAKTLQKYLGSDFKIEASVGHVKDLPPTKLGVNIEKDFEPEYIVLKGKEKVIDRITKSARGAERIYLAPDPDREGEAIAWHLAGELEQHGVARDNIYRAKFNEITKRAVTDAIANPDQLNVSLFDAQQARRILDRLVGYQISPLLWTKVTRGLSAGRVQSVAVRLVVEREREIQDFKAEEYWSVEAQVQAKAGTAFEMKLSALNGKKPQIQTIDQAREILEAVGALNLAEADSSSNGNERASDTRKLLTGKIDKTWSISSVEKKDVKRHPAPPFITSTLQQEAGRKLGFGASRTMSIAQRLYEGVELGSEGMTALITYMRTDSTRISNEALAAARTHIAKVYGDQYVPENVNVYKSKKGAQDAHEAIRPTDMNLTPERVGQFLEKEQLKLYTLIWNRFIACQMADAIFEQTKAEANPKPGYVFTATGLVSKFPGYLAVYEEGKDEGENSDTKGNTLPVLHQGDPLGVLGIRGSQHFTQPPPRYSEASLVKELEKRGIGRPSTYASIVSVIQDKEYVEKDQNAKFRPTELGFIVTDLLVQSFPEVLDVTFTAQMEEKLDQVEDGNQNWKELLREFYQDFKQQLDLAAKNMRSIKAEEIPTNILCDKCGQANLVVKWGRNGRFLACPRYPDCKNTKEYVAAGEDRKPTVQAVEESDEVCPNCGRKLVVKNGRHGRFLACPGYPDCKTIRPFKTGIKCPQCGAGDLVERTSKRGKLFFSCSTYPECKYAIWNRPVAHACAKCGSPFMMVSETSKRSVYICPNEACKNVEQKPPEKHGGAESAEPAEDPAAESVG